MSKRHLVAGVVIGACALTALPAQAAVRRPAPKVCNLIKDAPDDANAVDGAPSDPSLDVISGDVATNAALLTGVIRVKDLAKNNSMAPAGQRWDLTFTVGTTAVGLHVTVTADGKMNVPYDSINTQFDEAKNEIRMTVPIAKLPVKIVKGTVLQNLRINTGNVIGFDRAVFPGETITVFNLDSGSGTVNYVAGTASCVQIGKSPAARPPARPAPPWRGGRRVRSSALRSSHRGSP
jgi:hypothetical protein